MPHLAQGIATHCSKCGIKSTIVWYGNAHCATIGTLLALSDWPGFLQSPFPCSLPACLPLAEPSIWELGLPQGSHLLNPPSSLLEVAIQSPDCGCACLPGQYCHHGGVTCPVALPQSAIASFGPSLSLRTLSSLWPNRPLPVQMVT